MRFLVDENLGNRFAVLLKKAGYDAVFVGDEMRGSEDEEILSRAKAEKYVILTDDKDFGELVFRLHKPVHGIVLFRTLTNDPEKKIKMAGELLNKAGGNFIVVSEGRIRIRKLQT